MKRVVVTGATSMIGISLIQECIKNNTEVVAIIRPNSKNTERLPKSSLIKIVECSLDEILTLEEKLEKKYCAFYHFAWEATDRANINSAELQNKNITYTLNTLKLAKQLLCGKYISSGSQAEYGRVESKTINPYINVTPETSYGIAKYAAGRLGAMLAKELEIDFIWTRIFSVYGPYDNPRTMIMYAIDSMLQGKHTSFTKCEQMWDYLYMEDAGIALYLIGQKGKNEAIYNIGSGIARPLYEYIGILKNTIDSNIKTGIGEKEYAVNQVMNLCADISNLTDDTGFIPKTSFKDGIKQTIDWYKKDLK